MKNFFSKSLAVLTVLTMTFNVAIAQVVPEPEVLVTDDTSISTIFEEEVKAEPVAEEGVVEGASTETEEVTSLIPAPPTGPGSITVCKAIAKKVGDVVTIADPSEYPAGYTFTIPWVSAPATPGTEIFPAQPKIEADAYFTTGGFTPERNFFGGEGFDADCETFSNLPIGSYFYGEEEIGGGDASVTWTTKYSDQVTLPVNSFDDMDEYNDNLFTSGFDTTYAPGNKDADGVIFNTNADGHIRLYNGNETKHRTMIVLNIFEVIPVNACNPQVNLFTNGGFEEPIVTNGQGWDIYNDGEEDLGWDVAWNGAFADAPATAKLELQKQSALGFAPYELLQYAELDADWGYAQNEQASVVISQDIPTIVGNEYEISYAFSARPGTSAGENILEVLVNGDVYDVQGPVAGGGWQKYTVNFVATGESTTISFRDAGTPNSVGTFLDDVSVRCLGAYEGSTMTICHVTPSQNDQTLNLPTSAAQAHLDNHDGDYMGSCQNNDAIVDEPGNDQSSSSSSSGSSRKSTGGSVLGESTKGDVLGACVPFTEYHKKGDVGGEVSRIQEFLNEQVGAGIVVDGVYGDSTVKAVHAFQQKYFKEVISPWVPSFMARTTGKWYKTTKMMANEIIVCPEAPVFLEDPKIMYKVEWNIGAKQN